MLAMQMAMGEYGLALAPGRAGILGATAQYLLDAMERWEAGFGFGVGEIDSTLSGGVAPPRYLYAIGGRFDRAGVEKTLAACEECEPHEAREHAGQRYLAWGDDGNFELERREAPPAFDEFGRGAVFMFTDRHVVRSNWKDDLTAMIDASLGVNSVANREGFAEVAGEAGDEAVADADEEEADEAEVGTSVGGDDGDEDVEG
jgi:hypothetical protein